MTKSASLAKLSINELLAALRAVEDVASRRALTTQVYQICRSQWESSPRWGGMARHLLEDVHPMFRQGFARIAASARQGDARWVSEFRRVNGGLHHHHGLEDRMWFPRLRQLHPEVAHAIDVLESDHRELVALEGAVQGGDVAALQQFYEALDDHLNREEMISVPFLLAGTGGL